LPREKIPKPYARIRAVPSMKRQNTANRGQIAIQRGWRRRHRACLLWLVVVLALLACAVPAQAQFLVRQVNLAELTQRAEIIVEGRVVEVRYEGHPDYPHLATVFVALEVNRLLRGAPTARLTFREFIPGLGWQRGKYGYAVGQHLLLFLPQPSRYGLSSPLGEEQGLFRVTRDREGQQWIANGLGNRGLFRNVPAEAAKAGLTLSPQALKLAEAPAGPVRLESFLSLVEELTRLPRLE